MAPRVGVEVPPRTIDLAVVGHVNLDHMLEVERLPLADRTVPVRSRRTLLGGTAANLALAATRWGVRTALISRVGGDFPPEFLDRLRSAHVDIRGVERVDGPSSSACIIVHDARGRQMTLIDQGPMRDARRAIVPERVLADCGWIHLTTGEPGYIRRIQEWAAAHGVPTSVDPAQEVHYRWNRSSLRPLLAGAEIFFGNESEVLAATRMMRAASPRDLTEVVPLVVMTRGRRGARAYFRGGRVDVPARRTRRGLDPTGAGDAFRGGFYSGWFAGQPLGACLRAGHRAAARWLTERSAVARREAD
jgi:sugar/nucleoside kinase (ribokinase family)